VFTDISSAVIGTLLIAAAGGWIDTRASSTTTSASSYISLTVITLCVCVCVCVANYELRCTKPCIGKTASHSSSGLITKTCRMPLMRWLQLRFDCNSTALRPFDNQRYDLSAALRPRLINRSA